jgi:hypothetical protein
MNIIEELIKCYRDLELGSKMNTKDKFINILFLFSPSSYLLYPKITELFNNFLGEFFSIIILVIPFIIIWFIFNKMMKKILKKEYQINSKTLFWNSSVNITNLQNKYNSILRKWLIENNYYEKIDLIVSELDKKKERNYVKPPILTIATSGILLMILSEYFEKLYSVFEYPININMLNHTTVIISLIVIMISIMIFIIKQSLNIFWEYILNKDIAIIKKIQIILNDIQFDKKINM